MRKYRQGYFKPINPQKYRGNPTNIVYRSSWELKLYRYLDQNKNILEWSSEEFCIGYKSPLDNKMHRYYPDAWVRLTNSKGEIIEVVIEVKPSKQLVPPKKPAKPTKRYLEESKTWIINTCKFEAAKKYCEKKGWLFKIFSEKELGITK